MLENPLVNSMYIVSCYKQYYVIGVFPSAWYANVRKIAARSPLLLSMGAEQFLDKELEINHPLKIENIAPVSTKDMLFVILYCSMLSTIRTC